ncbi:DUF2071 domain-containing protein [Nocardioides sp. zg-536]|uniref:DUF2071 domain-containing protein n=1 Tax=Nocardioides faecalis TaxID=2803858 RepID=A0A938Y3J1_9ACTN|nr:DUF2071 domain-containing protein [Nocardioides faecalis]QVI57813.1 DUF2071 domain-containing protein [Nocardioides faecalis]
MHWKADPGRVQALLPDGLTVDTYDGAAWVGLTPFVLAKIRPPGVPPHWPYSRWPALARITSTPETNLRTYVRDADGRDGLWFLSLDIGSAALATAMRAAVGARYRPGDLSVAHDGSVVTYAGHRSRDPASYRLSVRLGASIAPSELEVWLTSRWRAYTVHAGRLLVTPVEHEPWPLREAVIETIEQNLTARIGLCDLGEPDLVHYSDGVQDVRIQRPRVLARHHTVP